MRTRVWLIGLLLWPLHGKAAPETAQLAWRTAEGDQLLQLNPQQVIKKSQLPADLKAPLGSLWKLYVYAWLSDTHQSESPYQCRGQSKEEVYCCTSGERIKRDAALVKSCGLYLEPQRLGISHDSWRTYWQARNAPDWLKELSQLTPQTEVPITQLLTTLQELPAQEEARRVLLDVTLNADEGRAPIWLGSRLRVKTWSWHVAKDERRREGGFAGWLVDGTPIWMRSQGTSKMVLARYAPILGKILPTPWPKEAGRCVEVDLFARYPLQEVYTSQGKKAKEGLLQGVHRVHFVNGNSLDVEGQSDLFLQRGAKAPRLTAHLSQEEYVARVLDREASATPVEAAKALAVTIRTYLLQNGKPRGDCLAIDDSSQRQRVAPRPASQPSRTIAAWTADLILAGGAVSYHATEEARGKLSWQKAVAQADSGMTFDAILAHAFPYGDFSHWQNPTTACQPLADAERWLQKQRRHWRSRLNSEIGYEEPNTFAVCLLDGVRPYTDHQRQRIHVRGLRSLQDQLDLTHEYLHLAFPSHPNGQDEIYIENLARQLILEQSL